MHGFDNGIIKFSLNEDGGFEITAGGRVFKSDGDAYYMLENKKTALKAVSVTEKENGILLDYGSFKAEIKAEADEPELHFEVDAKEDFSAFDGLYWPAPLSTEYSECGCTVLPIMQGMLIRDTDGDAANIMDGRIYSREAVMPWWGQNDGHSGYMAIADTPHDADILYNHKADTATEVRIRWVKSLGKMGYARRLTLRFFAEDASYVNFCKHYRARLEKAGEIVTLAQKIKNTAKVEGMIGTPVFNGPIGYYQIEPESSYYNAEEPEKNTELNLFTDIAAGLRRLHDIGVKRAYLHLDGWGLGGYDNLCPRVLPPSPQAGGAEGLKEIISTCKDLGYLLAYHDQYRDYYHKSPDYDENNAVMREDGSFDSSEDTIWFGGIEAQLCAKKAIDFVRRNYEEMKATGLFPDGAYLDVFSASILDECFSPVHPMTRSECVTARKKCFEYLHENGLIASSEECIGAFMDTLDLVHHSPYINAFFEHLGKEKFGTGVPLLNLVYHDCIIIPWAFADNGVWGLPEGQSGILHCLLNGGVPAVNFGLQESDVLTVELIGRLHTEVALEQMISHELLDDSGMRQKTVFSSGTAVSIDLENNSYRIEWADGTVSEGKR